MEPPRPQAGLRAKFSPKTAKAPENLPKDWRKRNERTHPITI
jgi:hypothetical protein